ncbi:MAG: hypothetical protein LUG61_03785 [Lachnospiraceae bacterium]|nr:hypothetical protein [Lachnospiraceae bacterium]
MELKQNLKKGLRLCMAVLTAALVFLGMRVNVLASQTAEVIDPDKSGSVTITMRNSVGETVGGGKLALYRVAYVYVDAVGQNSYVLTSDFSNSGVDLDDISPNDSALAATLATYADYWQLNASQTAQVGANGAVTFSNLPVGVYLVVQTEAAEGYYQVSPFVVTVPLSVNGTLIYDVDASPKVETLNQPSEETPKTPKKTTGSTTDAQTDTSLILPQTGAVLWPIFLIAGIGMAVFLTGWLLAFGGGLKRSGKDEA